MKLFCVMLLALMACVSAFHFTAPSKNVPRMTMLFNSGSKKTAPQQSKATQEYKVGEGSANKGTYIPDGLTPQQYEAFLAQEAAKKVKSKQKFFKGKEVETLTEWMEKNEQKGLSGQELNRKGHRMLKTKYEGWYTDESPV